ncbi:methionyl-tRNA formyltransferase-like protein [Hydrocarboniphaga sp.]|uniref:methionyl-tRNA formyltransferase-like protein n=1 Tax=Hydrocarboniphaga sp. TaxID=2033016 RepID=UPI003D0E5A4B
MHDFDERLERATARISQTYFQLPVAGREAPIYRERVYCYELYHQLRHNWPEYGYFLSGEIDKAGHPVIRHGYIAKSKPDFLIHVPEDMDNFAAIEVKPINGTSAGVQKDIRTLVAFLDHANYERALYLIYGDAEKGKALVSAQRQLLAQNLEGRVELWHHSKPGQPAAKIAVARGNV